MDKTLLRLSACFPALLSLTLGCNSSQLPGNHGEGTDGPTIRLDGLPGGSDLRPVADSPGTQNGTDVRNVGGASGSDALGPGPSDAPAAGRDSGLPQPSGDGGSICGLAGAACASAADCCGLACVGGICAGTACRSDGASCTSGGQCCSTLCSSAGLCAPLNPSCKTAGNACTTGAECCNGVCDANHQCASPGQVSYCNQVGDICRADTECCTGVCKIANGAAAGTCASISTSCLVDGTVCNGCGSCCSHFCGPFGGGGPDICQPASGCRIQGDLCHNDSDCCGGDAKSGLPGAGLVKCEPDPVYGARIGTCGGPVASNCPDGTSTCKNSCNPEGNVCHWLNTAVCEGATTSKRNDCCACISGKECCQLDRTGIPRCNAIAACVPAGGACAYSGDCCNNLPCVPDPVTGHLTCGSKCVPLGGLCTTNADCCIGTLCQVPPGSLAGVCTIPVTPPPVGRDAGPPIPDGNVPNADTGTSSGPDSSGQPEPDAAVPPPICAYFGQACSVTVPCCGGTSCVNGAFLDCTASDTDCICFAGE